MSSTEERQIEMQFEDFAQQREAASLGMWTFLATEVLFFGGVFLGYAALRLTHHDAFAEASGHLNVVLGTINTAILLGSSLFMALAEHSVTRRPKAALRFLVLVIVLGAIFLGIKGYEYHHEWAAERVPVLNWSHEGPHGEGMQLFFFLYFSMTGLHALHMIIGIGVIAALILKLRGGAIGPRRPLPVEMTALYWHFVDIVWVFLFPLLYLIGGGSS